jgi:hypothetical protein
MIQTTSPAPDSFWHPRHDAALDEAIARWRVTERGVAWLLGVLGFGLTFWTCVIVSVSFLRS